MIRHTIVEQFRNRIRFKKTKKSTFSSHFAFAINQKNRTKN